MKSKWFALAAIAFLSGCATKPQITAHLTPPSTGRIEASIKSVSNSIASAKSKAIEIQATNDTPLVKELLHNLEQANLEAARAQQETLLHGNEVAAVTTFANQAIDTKNQVIIDLSKEKDAHGITSAAYHRLKLFNALIVGAFAGLFSIRYLGAVTATPPWGWLAPILVGLGAASLLFWLL